MAYTEKLSEQIAAAGGASNTTTSATKGASTSVAAVSFPGTNLAGFDMQKYHRVAAIAHGRGSATASLTTAGTTTTTADWTAKFKIVAGVDSAVTATTTTVLSTTLTVSDVVRVVSTGTGTTTITAVADGCCGVDVTGEDLGENYRYVRATVSVGTVNTPTSVQAGEPAAAEVIFIGGEPRYRPRNVTD